MVIDDGVIKYDTSGFQKSEPLSLREFESLEAWRKKLYQLNLIGEYPIEKVGFGNLSCLQDYQSFMINDKPQFVITGTQTGKHKNLSGDHYTRVLDYDLHKMTMKAMGPVMASSEALSHASIYLCSKEITSVFHIHSQSIWNGMIEQNMDSTPSDVPYGTYEMALAVEECVGNKKFGTFVMKGHQDGVMIFGRSNEECGELTLKLNERFNS
ncbi:hypothetical protein HBN50_13940 [Halobacteriovorax sp. GB3]|uniref:class II aldolase/adducin family protein n=1 Tax=Halobacteriovorax sp. GB3 TaxID=2719615 RepID=UPI00235E06F8|nr:class II aldolase/adducin family protein [Halobacteriovorax sp. GB3]MDD0854209.1 hypothetical protein [Halobacteriovorax sp. GB3]